MTLLTEPMEEEVDMHSAHVRTWHDTTSFDHRRYRVVYGRVLLFACIAVAGLLMWQGRVWFERQTSALLMSPSPVVETVLPADSDTIIAKSANRAALLVLDADTGRIAEWNDGAEHLVGWKAEEVVGQDLSVLLSSANSLEKHLKLLQDENVRNNLLKKTLQLNCWTYTSTGVARQFNVRVRGWQEDEKYYVICELEDDTTLLNITHVGEKPPDRLP